MRTIHPCPNRLIPPFVPTQESAYFSVSSVLSMPISRMSPSATAARAADDAAVRLDEQVLQALIARNPGSYTARQLRGVCGRQDLRTKEVNQLLYKVLQPVDLVVMLSQRDAAAAPEWQLSQAAAETLAGILLDSPDTLQRELAQQLLASVAVRPLLSAGRPAQGKRTSVDSSSQGAVAELTAQLAATRLAACSSKHTAVNMRASTTPATRMARGSASAPAATARDGGAVACRTRMTTAAAANLAGNSTRLTARVSRGSAAVTAAASCVLGPAAAAVPNSRRYHYNPSSMARQQQSYLCTLQSEPRLFRHLFQQAYEESVQPTPCEEEAARACIDYVQQLLRCEINEAQALQLQGTRGYNVPVRIDRICQAGSFAKRTHVKEGFDVDLVLFLIIPPDYWHDVSTVEPGTTHQSKWMEKLQLQLHDLLRRSAYQLEDLKTKGTAAITFCMSAARYGYASVISFDVLLAPDLAGGCESIDKAAMQRIAVLQPLFDATAAWTSGRVEVRTPHALYADLNARSIWLQESTTEYIKQAAADCGMPSSVVVSTIQLTKAWVRRGLQGRIGAGASSGKCKGYAELKSFMIELLVLRAAQCMGQQLSTDSSNAAAVLAGQQVDTHASSCPTKGDLLLDLFLQVLKEAQCWAARADDSNRGCNADPVLFVGSNPNITGMQPFYTEQQAYDLQALLLGCGLGHYAWSKGERCFAQPVVVHPVDFMHNIFALRKFSLDMWRQFAKDAETLHHELCTGSWGDILTKTTLADALWQHTCA